MDSGRLALWIGLVAAAAIVIALLRPVCRKLQLIDLPSERKQHGESVPVAGGLGMALVAAPAMLGADVFGVVPLDNSWWVVIGTALVLLVIGIVDDRVDLGASARMVAQIGAALVLVYFGDFRVETLGALGELGRYSVPFTVLVIVTFLNACNMVDGGDGLLGSILLPPLVAVALVSSAPLSSAAGLLAAVVFGFLVFNWPARSGRRSRMRVFMGNGGVLFIAFCTAAVLIRASGPAGPILPGGVALLTLIPLMDLATTCVRRIVMRVSPLSPDRGHIHHRLLMKGLSPTQIAQIYFGLTVVATLTAVLLPAAGVDGLWQWAIAALLLTTATMMEIWRSTRERVRARAQIHLQPAEACSYVSVGPQPLVSRSHQHPLPDKLLQRTGTSG